MPSQSKPLTFDYILENTVISVFLDIKLYDTVNAIHHKDEDMGGRTVNMTRSAHAPFICTVRNNMFPLYTQCEQHVRLKMERTQPHSVICSIH